MNVISQSDTHQPTSSKSTTADTTVLSYEGLPSSKPLHKFDLEKAKGIAQDLLSLIFHRYELDGKGFQFWHTANNIPPEAWDIMKYKFAVKALETKQHFLMVFGGSSVTAGHDHHYNQSYPSVVRKRMVPLLAAMGIKLVVHNIAMGANACNPYDLCYESLGGVDPDWIGWEQSYNCGHDEGAFEVSARWAGWSKNPGVVYFSASGAWSPDKCPLNDKAVTGSSVPYCDEDWKEADAVSISSSLLVLSTYLEITFSSTLLPCLSDFL